MTPVENPRVTSKFGQRKSPISGRTEQHNGEDMVDAKGNRNLRAIWDTIKTEFIQNHNGGRGYTAYLYYSGALRVLYQHCASFSAAVLAKKPLKQGDSVGMMGTTGDSTGVHLHIEVQVLKNSKWVAVEPSRYTEVPNIVGIHPGNNRLDGAATEPQVPAPPTQPEAPASPPEPEKPVLYEYSGIVASPGDAVDIEALLDDKAIPYVKKTV